MVWRREEERREPLGRRRDVSDEEDSGKIPPLKKKTTPIRRERERDGRRCY